MSVGLLGIITKVTLQCVPAFLLEESIRPLSLDQCVEQLPAIAASAEHVKLWTELYSGSCMVIGMNRTHREMINGDLSALDWKVLVFFTTYVCGHVWHYHSCS